MKELILFFVLLVGITTIIILGKPKKKKEVIVSKRSMSPISKLATVEATVKSLIVAIDDERNRGPLLGLFRRDRYYIETMVSTIRGLVNMEDFSEENIKKDAVQNTITITLPTPKVEKANILQEKSSVVWKKGGEFSVQELFEYRKQKQDDLDNDKKIQQIIIEQAKQNTEEFFVVWFKTMGFADASINFEKAE